MHRVLAIHLLFDFLDFLQLFDCLFELLPFEEGHCDGPLGFEGSLVGVTVEFFEQFVATGESLYFLLKFAIGLIVGSQSLVEISNFLLVLVVDAIEDGDRPSDLIDALHQVALLEVNLRFQHISKGVVLGVFARHLVYQVQGVLDELQGQLVVLQLQVAVRDELQGLGVVDGPIGGSAVLLDVKSTVEDLKGILITVDLEVAAAEGGEHVGVVYLALLDFSQLRVLLESNGEVVDCLLVALVVEIGLTDVVVCFYQPEVRLSMGKDQNLTQGEFVHADSQNLLIILAGHLFQ